MEISIDLNNLKSNSQTKQKMRFNLFATSMILSMASALDLEASVLADPKNDLIEENDDSGDPLLLYRGP